VTSALSHRSNTAQFIDGIFGSVVLAARAVPRHARRSNLVLEMHLWYRLTPEKPVDPGEFFETRLLPVDPSQPELQSEFLDELALRLMASYESESAARLISLKISVPSPTRTLAFYKRLLDADGNPTRAFITLASEVLAGWIQEALENALVVEPGGPHNCDPGFDLVSLFGDSADPDLLLTQVKATENQLQHNCSEALQGFKRLDAGDYDAELMNRLALLERTNRLPPLLKARDLLMSPNRNYRITALHSEDRDQMLILTTYDEAIAGARRQRGACLFRIVWPPFWTELSARVHAQLA
jgi:hypothetical protein